MTRRFSPCVGICSATSLGDPVCRGCGRTEQEVVNWNHMTQAAREAVWVRLEQKSARDRELGESPGEGA